MKYDDVMLCGDGGRQQGDLTSRLVIEHLLGRLGAVPQALHGECVLRQVHALHLLLLELLQQEVEQHLVEEKVVREE